MYYLRDQKGKKKVFYFLPFDSIYLASCSLRALSIDFTQEKTVALRKQLQESSSKPSTDGKLTQLFHQSLVIQREPLSLERTAKPRSVPMCLMRSFWPGSSPPAFLTRWAHHRAGPEKMPHEHRSASLVL